MKKMTILMLLIACTEQPVTRQKESTQTSWRCYTHATCNGVTQNAVHDLCAGPSSADVLLAGDAAARDWAAVWKGACSAEQGTIGTPLEGHICPQSWGCEATCELGDVCSSIP